MLNLPKYIIAWCGSAARFYQMDFTCKMRLVDIYINYFVRCKDKKLLPTNYCKNEINKLYKLQDDLLNE